MTLSESELFTGDTSNDNHFPGPVIREVLSREVNYRHPTENLYFFSYELRLCKVSSQSAAWYKRHISVRRGISVNFVFVHYFNGNIF